MPAGTLTLARGLPSVVALRGLAGAAFFAAEIFLPLMMTTERGVTPAWAGLALTVGALGWSAGSWIVGRQSDPDARARTLRTGMLLMALGIVAQLILLVAAVPLAASVAAWVLAGVGMGLVYPLLSALTLALSPDGAQGTNSAALQLADSLASSAVLAVGGTLLAGGDAGTATWLACLVVAAAIALAGAAVAGRVVR